MTTAWFPPPGWFNIPPTDESPDVLGWWALLHGDGFFSSEGVLTAQAYAKTPAAAPLSSEGVLSSEAYAITPAQVSLSGAGALSSEAYAIVPGMVVLSGSGALAAVPFEKYSRPATLSGAGTLASTAKQQFQVPVDFSGAGNLVVVPFERYARNAPLSGAGALSSDAYAIVPGTVILGGEGSLSSAAYAIVPREALLSGAGTLSASAIQQFARSAQLAGAGALSAGAVQQFQRTPALSGGGTLAAAVIQSFARVAAMVGAGTLSASAIQQFQRAVDLAGVGVLTCLADIVATDPVAFRVAHSSGSEGVGGSITCSISPSTDDSVIAIGINGGNGDITQMTYGPSAIKMRCICQIRFGATTSSTGAIMSVWVLDAVPSGGAATVTATMTGSNWCQLYAVAYDNVRGYGVPNAVVGNSNSFSHAAVIPGLGAMLIEAFTPRSNSRTISSVTGGGTNRVLDNSGFVTGLVVEKDASTTFGANLSGTEKWGAITIPALANPQSGPRFRHCIGNLGDIISSSAQTVNVQAAVDDYIFCDIVVNGSANITAVTCAGVAMTQIYTGNVTRLTGGTGIIRRYRSATKVTSGQISGGTVAVSVTQTTGNRWNFAATSVANVSTIGSTSGSAYSSNSQPSQAISLASGERALHLFSMYTRPGYILGGANVFDGGGSNFALPVVTMVNASGTITNSITSTQWGSLYTVLS